MKTFLATCAATLLLLTTSTTAQEPPKDAKPPAAATDAKSPDTANPPKEETWPSDHTIKINNQSIAYKATASTTLLKDEKGEPTALIYSTAYTPQRHQGLHPAPHRLHLQRRPRLRFDLAAHGRVRPAPRRHRRPRRHPARRPTRSKTTPIPCSTKPTWCSLTPSAQASATP